MPVERFSPRLLAGQVHAVWDARAEGLSPEQVAERVSWSATSVRQHIADHGGVRPRWGRGLQGRYLSFEEREHIAVRRAERASAAQIGRELGRSTSTITREVARHTDASGRYRASVAHREAHVAARRPKQARLAVDGPLRDRVQADLAAKSSPEQIAGRLRLEFPDDPEMQVSHETIYQAVYLQARGGLRRDLVARLRTGRTMRRPDRVADQRRGRIAGMTLIAERPEEVAERLVPGHWEGDLIVGRDGESAIGTLVERVTNYLILVHLPARENRVEALTRNLTAKLIELPDALRRSLTWDQGIEMHGHRRVAVDADIAIYFADPHSPWQRATNENTNGLLRQYFPKGTDLSGFDQLDLDAVAIEMNDRPRKRLAYATPREKMSTYLLQ